MEEAKAAEFLKVWAQKLLVSYILLIIEVTEPTQMRRDIGVTSPWDEHQKVMVLCSSSLNSPHADV